MQEYRNESISNAELTLHAQDVIMGNSTIIDSSINILSPADVYIFCSSFKNTTIAVAKQCFRQNWRGCFFDSCKFKGKYYDVCFGVGDEKCNLEAGLRACDFSECKMHFCTFFNCTPADLRLPGWPHVTVLDVQANANDFASLCGDPVIKRMHSLLRLQGLVALTFNMPQFIKQTKPWIYRLWNTNAIFARARSEPIPPEPVIDIQVIRELLAQKSYVFM